MTSISSRQPQNTSVTTVQQGCHHEIALAQWQRHYQAETVDLRYFFHSGWSS